MARHQSLLPLFLAAEAVLPALNISGESIAYYASLVDYHTVQKLQQLPRTVARLYLLCYIHRRSRTINDNLVQAFIHLVHKTESTAAQQLRERLLADKAEGHENAASIGRVLGLFLDNRLDGSVSFREVKRRAFAILPAGHGGGTAFRECSCGRGRCNDRDDEVRQLPAGSLGRTNRSTLVE